MVSETLLNSRWKLFLPLFSILAFTGSGILFARSEYFIAAVFWVTGLIIIRLIIKIYDANNETIVSFIESLRNDDTAVYFPGIHKNKSLRSLYESMNRLNEHFREIRVRNLHNETYYKTLIQQSSAGLLVLNGENRIELINRAACNYAGISPDSSNPDMLRIKHPAFFEAACNLKTGDSMTFRSLFSGNLQMLVFRASMIRMKDVELKLVSIQDIRYELESRELESYRKLINVMTHEIMNLLSPLTSASRELYSMFHHDDKPMELSRIDEAMIKKVVNGLQLIDEQSNGLLNFVNNYRKISKVPSPEFSTFDVSDWVEQLKIVFGGKMKDHGIVFHIIADKSLKQIIADKKLLNQVIINLINNSFEAVMANSDEKRIDIQLSKNKHNRVLIKIINNGPLIPPELLGKIFVPFFTTKENGSGIGLSISLEIVKLHNGSLTAVSTEESKTCFIVEF